MGAAKPNVQDVYLPKGSDLAVVKAPVNRGTESSLSGTLKGSDYRPVQFGQVVWQIAFDKSAVDR